MESRKLAGEKRRLIASKNKNIARVAARIGESKATCTSWRSFQTDQEKGEVRCCSVADRVWLSLRATIGTKAAWAVSNAPP